MYPLELCDRLRPLVADRILQDLSNGCASRLLAPCTGRAITGIRWRPDTGDVLLVLEPPRLPDEPRWLSLAPAEVERLEVRATNQRSLIRLLLQTRDHSIQLWLLDIARREQYP